MKPWKTTSATNETRGARPSFRLDPQWSGYGPILPQGTSRKPKTGHDPAKPPDVAKTGTGHDPAKPPDVAKPGTGHDPAKPPDVAKTGTGHDPAKPPCCAVRPLIPSMATL